MKWADGFRIVCLGLLTGMVTGCGGQSSASDTTTSAGSGVSATHTTRLTVDSPKPTLTMTATPTTIQSGGSAILTWSSTEASTCTGSGAWTGSLPNRGSYSIGSIGKTSAFTISCNGPAGAVTKSVTVNVTASNSASTLTATVTWVPPTTNTDGSPVTPLAHYTVYYGASPEQLSHSVTVTGATSDICEISGLTSGTWYFAVVATAVDGEQSVQSALGSVTL